MRPLIAQLLAWLLAFLPGLLSGWRTMGGSRRWLTGGALLASALLTVYVVRIELQREEREEHLEATQQAGRLAAQERAQRATPIRARIEQFLIESDRLRDELYPLCRVPDYRRWEEKVEKQWREPVIRYLGLWLRPEAKDEFQRVSYQYEHRECDEIEWTKKWLAELVQNLRRVRDNLEQYLR